MSLPHRFPFCAALIALVSLSSVAGVKADDKSSNGSPIGVAKTPASAKPVDPLAKLVDRAIETSVRRYLTADYHTPWQIMHGILALRHDYQIKHKGKKVNAVDWVSRGATYRGEHWFEKTANGGRAHPFSQPFIFEGHPGQFLAIFSMANLPTDHKLKAKTGTITIADMIKYSKNETNGNEEIAWTIWGLSHYLGPDAKWVNKHGEQWSLEKLVARQVREPVYGQACGGTHAMFALAYARNGYLQSGKPLRGPWLEVDQKVKRYVREASMYQNSDGSFSAAYFRGRRYAKDFETRLGSSGHVLEFLMVALPQHRLKEDWVRNGVASVAQDLIENGNVPAECSALYHALDALVLYRDRTNPKPLITRMKDKEESTGDPLLPIRANKPTDKYRPVASERPVVHK